VVQIPICQFFRIEFNFNRTKSATKFCSVTVSSDEVVEQSISREITENTGQKVFLLPEILA